MTLFKSAEYEQSAYPARGRCNVSKYVSKIKGWIKGAYLFVTNLLKNLKLYHKVKQWSEKNVSLEVLYPRAIVSV